MRVKRVSIALLFLAGIMGALIGCSPSEQKTESTAATNAPSKTDDSAPENAESIPAVSEADAAKAQELAKEAETVMLDPKLPAGEKYPKALAMFNEALKVDPQNSLASKSKALIEGIYQSMGKPVPGTK